MDKIYFYFNKIIKILTLERIYTVGVFICSSKVNSNKESESENLVNDAAEDENTQGYDQTPYMTLITISLIKQIQCS